MKRIDKVLLNLMKLAEKTPFPSVLSTICDSNGFLPWWWFSRFSEYFPCWLHAYGSPLSSPHHKLRFTSDDWLIRALLPERSKRDVWYFALIFVCLYFPGRTSQSAHTACIWTCLIGVLVAMWVRSFASSAISSTIYSSITFSMSADSSVMTAINAIYITEPSWYTSVYGTANCLKRPSCSGD